MRSAHEALRAQLLEEVGLLALAPDHERREDHDARVLGQREHVVDHLRHALRGERDAVLGAVRLADAGEEQAQVVVDLGDRADRGARVVAGRFLLDGDGRRKPLDQVHVGLFHELQELPRVGREGLDVAPLALGVERVEGERGLARARQARDHDEPVARQVEVTFFRLWVRAPRMRMKSMRYSWLGATCYYNRSHPPFPNAAFRPLSRPAPVSPSRPHEPPRSSARELGLAWHFGLRLLGLFIILPVFAIYARAASRAATDLTLVGLAIGAYGLTQALLQIPFGWLSDRYRAQAASSTSVSLVFAMGSFVAAVAPNIWIVDPRPRDPGRGRHLGGGHRDGRRLDPRRAPHQGDGASSASTIGVTFALSMVAGPVLERLDRRARHLRAHRRARARGDRHCEIRGAGPRPRPSRA